MFYQHDFARVLAVATIAAAVLSCSGSAVAATPPPMPAINDPFLLALSTDYATCVHSYQFEGFSIVERGHDEAATWIDLQLALKLGDLDPALIWRAYHRDCQPWHQPQYLDRYFDRES